MRIILSAILMLFLVPAWGQNLSNLRRRTIEFNADTILLDTLSVIPTSFRLVSNGIPVDSSKYELLWFSGKLIVDASLKGSTVQADYRVFSMLFSERTFNKDPNL
ncbi:MAG: hypothetical protein JKX84_05905, partial [Flavobacteriales bacterium]|nr:hypothetical protein [Flavobacteriales bacterium]